MSGEVGYMVLNRDRTTLWDGEVHASRDEAIAGLREAESDPSEYGSGWYLAECRPVPAQLALFEAKR